MAKLRLMALLILVMSLFSCGKNKADLNSSLVKAYDGKTSNPSCIGLDLSSDLLTKNTMIKTFECIGWSEEFPKIYNYLMNLTATEVDLVFGPANKTLFSSKSKRDKLLKFVQKEVTHSEIKFFSEKLQSIVGDKLILDELINLMLEQNFKLPSKKLTKELLKFLNVFAKKTQTERELVLKSLIKLNTQDKSESLLRLKQTVFKKVVSGSTQFIKNTSHFLSPVDWPVNFLNSYEPEQIRTLVTYKYFNESINNDLSLIENSIRLNTNNCSEFNNVYYLNFESELDERLETLANSTKVDFLMDIFELSQRFSLFNNICPYEDFNKVSSRTLQHLRAYAIMPGGYEFLKSLANISQKTENKFFLFDFIQEEAFDDLAKILISDEKYNIGLLFNLQNALKNLNEEDFENLLTILKQVDDYLRKGNLASLEKTKSENIINIFDYVLNEIIMGEGLYDETNLLLKFLDHYPSLYNLYEENYSDKKLSYASWFIKLKFLLKDVEFRDEIVRFWDDQVFFKLIGFISRGQETLSQQNVSSVEDIVEAKVQDSVTLLEEKKLEVCLVKFNEIASNDYNFWSILKDYPQECVEVETKKNLGSYIFQWTLQIDLAFQNIVQDRFSYQYGMISPDMMSFYHSLMHIINTQLEKRENYVESTVKRIRDELFEKGLSNVIDDTLSVLVQLNEKTDIVEKSIEKLAFVNPQKFDRTIKSYLASIKNQENLERYDSYSCIEINSNVGANNCFTQVDLEVFLNKLIDLLIRDNGAQKKLYELFVEFLVGEGIAIPFDSNVVKQKKFSLEETVRFVFDMTSKKTEKEITFRTKDTKNTFFSNRAERLEVVIREISFLNNFYGAFFMNTVARAKKYYKKVKSMKKNVKLMDSTSEYFRRRGFFPEETEWAFKNIVDTYSSLYELETRHRQPDGGERRYGDFIQALLTMVVETSSPESQKYSPFQSPKPDKVNNHNGVFITEITRIGGLTHLGTWIRKVSNNDVVAIVKNKKFKRINEDLLTVLSKKKLSDLIYFVANHKNRRLIIKDFTNFLYKINDEDSNLILNLLKDVSYIASVGLKDSKGDSLVKIFKAVIDNYDYLREQKVFSFDGDVIKILADYTNQLSNTSEEDISLLSSNVVSLASLISPEIISQLLKDKDFVDNLSKLKESFVAYMSTPDFNTGFLEMLLADTQLNFEPLHNMIHQTYVVNNKKDYLINIIKVLSKEEQGETNATYALKEIFENKQGVVVKFLSDMFNKFYRSSYQ